MLFIAAQELDDLSCMYGLLMKLKYTQNATLGAKVLAHTVMNGLAIVLAFLLRKVCLTDA
jgi:hypothetical protein